MTAPVGRFPEDLWDRRSWVEAAAVVGFVALGIVGEVRSVPHGFEPPDAVVDAVRPETVERVLIDDPTLPDDAAAAVATGDAPVAWSGTVRRRIEDLGVRVATDDGVHVVPVTDGFEWSLGPHRTAVRIGGHGPVVVVPDDAVTPSDVPVHFPTDRAETVVSSSSGGSFPPARTVIVDLGHAISVRVETGPHRTVMEPSDGGASVEAPAVAVDGAERTLLVDASAPEDGGTFLVGDVAFEVAHGDRGSEVSVGSRDGGAVGLRVRHPGPGPATLPSPGV